MARSAIGIPRGLLHARVTKAEAKGSTARSLRTQFRTFVKRWSQHPSRAPDLGAIEVMGIPPENASHDVNLVT
jgi:hypothetical protein